MQRQRHFPQRHQGFTLIEIMVVVVIIAILAAMVVPKVMSRPDEARVVAAKQDIAALMQALKLYRLDNKRYPTSEQGLQALVARPTMAPVPDNWKGEGYVEKLPGDPWGQPMPPNWKSGGYLDRLPKDPWGHDYQYLSPGTHGEIDVFSLGADGAPGGEGFDADIGNWML